MGGQETDCALFLARGPELRIVWANETYLAMLGELSSGVIGMRLDEVSPLGPLRARALREVIRTGESQDGEDRVFSAEDGTRVFEWRAYRPLADHVLVTILSRRTRDEDR